MDIFDHDQYPLELSPRLAIAVRQILFARRYTLSLLADLQPAEWFWMPPGEGYQTHIAWQAGHLAMAQYGLTLFRQRGRGEDDSQLMSGKFRKLFMRGTQAKPDPAANPAPEEIRAVLNRVQDQMLREVQSFDGPTLDEQVEAPHAAFDTRLGAILFCSHHEMLHAGQIGMLRRMMGKASLR